MLAPYDAQLMIESDGLLDRFIADRITTFDTHSADGSAFKKDDGIGYLLRSCKGQGHVVVLKGGIAALERGHAGGDQWSSAMGGQYFSKVLHGSFT